MSNIKDLLKRILSKRMALTATVLMLCVAVAAVVGVFVHKKFQDDRASATGYVPDTRGPAPGARMPGQWPLEEDARPEGWEEGDGEHHPPPDPFAGQPYTPPVHHHDADAAVQRSLRTIEEINRINRMNQQLLEQQRRMQNQR